MAVKTFNKELKNWNRKVKSKKEKEKKVNLKANEQYQEENRLKRISIFLLLNPKNLQKEVHAYGYHFSEFTHAITILLVLFACAGLGVLFELDISYILFISMITVFLLPWFILDMFKRMYEQKRFAQAGQYVEQILYSFKHTQKIYSALADCLLIFDDGRMKEKITQAIAYIDDGKAKTKEGVLKEALDIISLEFPCDKIRNANQLLVNVEERGGSFEESANLLLDDNSKWIQRGYVLQADKKRRHVEVAFSILTSIVLCIAVLYSLNWMGNISSMQKQFNIFSFTMIQITSCIFILLLLMIYFKSSRTLTNDWLSGFPIEKEKVINSSYEYVMHYNEAKAQKKSLFFTIPVIFSMIAIYLYSYKWLLLPLILLACVVLFQHKIGYMLAKQTVIKQLYLSFPQWLMDIALLMQNNNVYVSLAKSIEKSNHIIKIETEDLLKRIQKQPNAILSYTEFCRKFDIPEIYSCMKMLYSIAESETGDVNQQIMELLTQMSEMQRKAEQIENEHIKFKMEKIFFYPIAVLCCKMAFDMAFGMILMIGSFQSVFMGG